MSLAHTSVDPIAASTVAVDAVPATLTSSSSATATVHRLDFGQARARAPRAAAVGQGAGSVSALAPAASEKSDRHDRVRELLSRMIESEDADVRRELAAQVVLEHQGVARSIAARYRGRGVERADLEQLAYLGMLKAVQRWQPGRSEDFLQFAVPTVAGEIKRYFRDHSFMVRPPRRIQEVRAALSVSEADGVDQGGPRRSEEDLSDEFGVTAGVIREARQASELCHPRSLDAPTITGQALTQSWGCEDERIEQVEDRLTVSSMMTALTERERAVVRMRFVDGLSQARIGEEIGVSQMQVSRLLRGIAGKLRDQLAS